MEAIYERPRDYDLEHDGDEEDRTTGFSAEAWFGDYSMRRLRTSSRKLIGVGVKSASWFWRPTRDVTPP